MDIGKDLAKAFDDGYEQGKKDAVKWISVNDRLPEVGEKVLCICDTGYEGMPVYGIGWRVSGDFWHILVLLGKNPTVLAWMPLPSMSEGE